MSSPTQRSLAECKKRGYRASVVERFVAVTRRRHDAFGFGDVLVIDDQPGAVLIQATVTGSMSSRVNKIKTECKEAALAWLSAGNRVWVWGWAKRGPMGKRKLWTLREVAVTIDDLRGCGV